MFLAGAGIGSVIAECALRLGFENITISHGDVVEITNLNRQNYIQGKIGKKKAEFLKNRSCVHLLYKLALRQTLKQFPEFYLLGLDDL